MQMMVAVFDFPDKAELAPPGHVPELAVDWVRGGARCRTVPSCGRQTTFSRDAWTEVDAARRSARCLIPCSILRSITSEAGSIGSMPSRAASVGRRKRLRLISRVAAVALLEHERPDPVAVLGAPGEHVLGLDALDPHPVGAVADRVADLRVLELGQDAVDAVHVEAEQVLDPVVRVGAAARGRAHLRQPRPDGGGGGVDRDRARRDAVGVLEQLVAGQARAASASVAPHVRIGRRSSAW